MVDLRAIIDNLVGVGFYSVVLPFLLVYVVVFAILEKSGIFKTSSSAEDKQTKNVNAIIAFVFALFAVASLQTVLYIQSLIINIVLFIIFILVVLILLAFIFGEDYKKLFENKWTMYIIGGLVFIIALSILFNILGVWDWFWDLFDSFESGDDTWMTIVVLLLIGGVIYWVTNSDKKDNSNKEE